MQEPVKILIVSGDENTFIRLSALLTEAGEYAFTAEWAPYFEAGIEVIHRRCHDIYFVDYPLGEKNGLDLVRDELDGGHPSPFILMTEKEDLGLSHQAEAAGAADFLVKWTFSAHELVRTIRYAINHSRDLARIWDLNAGLERKIQERTKSLSRTVRQLKNHILAKEKAQKDLQAHEKMLQQLIQGYGVGSFSIVERDYKCTLAGGKSHQLLNPSADSTACERLFPMLPPQDWERIRAEMEKVFAGEEIRDLDLPGEWQGRHFIIDAFPLLNLDGSVERIVVMTRDVTALRSALQQLETALLSEQELGKLKSRFVTMASHEFRTPLTAIASSAFLVENYAERQDFVNIKKHAGRIRQSVDNLNAILSEFLSLGKLEENKIRPVCKPFNLRDLVDDVYTDLSHLFKPGQEFISQFTGNETVILDQSVLKNVLINLISNAIKYSPENTKINVSCEVTGSAANITILDEGIGISDQDQQKLFTRFFRAENAADVQGTGLGLYIVKRYVDLMRGAVSFESKLGKGSTFRVAIPLQNAGSQELGEKGE